MVRMSTADPRFLCSVFQIIVCPFVFFFGPLYCLSFCFYLVHYIVCPFVFIWSMILCVLLFLFGPLYCLSFCFYLVHDIVCPFVFIWSMILSVLLFLFGPWYCLSFDLWHLITLLISSNWLVMCWKFQIYLVYLYVNKM
jgi:hypothetical protein